MGGGFVDVVAAGSVVGGDADGPGARAEARGAQAHERPGRQRVAVAVGARRPGGLGRDGQDQGQGDAELDRWHGNSHLYGRDAALPQGSARPAAGGPRFFARALGGKVPAEGKVMYQPTPVPVIEKVEVSGLVPKGVERQ